MTHLACTNQLTFICLFCFLGFFEAGFYYVALVGLELTMYTRMIMNSQKYVLCTQWFMLH